MTWAGAGPKLRVERFRCSGLLEEWDARYRRRGLVMIFCPECGAPAEVYEKQATPCRTWEAINSGGKIHVTEAHEVLVIVEVLCAAGHRFMGPEEMLDATSEASGWEEKVA
jgi:hypothetical protein